MLMPTSQPPVRLNPRNETPCMRKLDRLPWTDPVMVTMRGAKIAVRAATAEMLAALLAMLPAGARISRSRDRVADRMISVIAPSSGPRRGMRRFGLVYLDHVEAIRSHDAGEVVETFESFLRFSLAQYFRRGIVVHGGAVAWRGKAVLLPATTHSGKSHLVSALIEAGADYITDEHILLDGNGHVLPWYKPMALRSGPGARQTHVAPEALGASVVRKPARVAMILATAHGGDPEWPPEPVPASHGMIDLLSNTIAARMYPARVMTVLTGTARNAACYKGNRPDAAIAAADILAMLDRLP